MPYVAGVLDSTTFASGFPNLSAFFSVSADLTEWNGDLGAAVRTKNGARLYDGAFLRRATGCAIAKGQAEVADAAPTRPGEVFYIVRKKSVITCTQS